MASTRNKNTPGNYCLEQRENKQNVNYTTYAQYGTATTTRLPGNGLTPAKLPWNQMSHNPADIESFLFGNKSPNLVNPAPTFVPELTKLGTVNIYEKTPIMMPEPLTIEKNQRPLPR